MTTGDNGTGPMPAGRAPRGAGSRSPILFLLLLLSPLRIAWGYETSVVDGCVQLPPPWGETCCDNAKVRHAGNEISLFRVLSSVPSLNDTGYHVIDEVTERFWSRNNDRVPEPVDDIALTVTGVDALFITGEEGNGFNEIYYGSSGDFSDRPVDRYAFTSRTFDVRECAITESDVVFSPDEEWNDNYFLQSDHRPFFPHQDVIPRVGVVMHQIGHVLGLNHEGDVYNVMGSDVTHLSMVGTVTWYLPGADGRAGKRYLYSTDDAPRRVTVTVFGRVGELPDGAGRGSSVHAVGHWKNAIRTFPDLLLCDPTGSWRDSGDDPARHGVDCFVVDAGTTVEVPFTFENLGDTDLETDIEVSICDTSICYPIEDQQRIATFRATVPAGSANTAYLPVKIPRALKGGEDWYLGVDLFTPGSSEHGGHSNNAWYPFTVRNGNLPPIVTPSLGLPDSPVSTNMNTAVPFDLEATDPNDDPLTYALATPPSHGSVVVTASGEGRYVPDFDYEGEDSFTYRVEDPYGLSGAGGFHIVVVRPKKQMVVTKTGSGDGRITSNPHGIDCGAECITEFAVDGTVVLDAVSAAGSIFRGWDGDCSGSGGARCTLTIDTAKVVLAEFDAAPVSYALTVDRIGTGSGTVASRVAGIDCGADCRETYAAGAGTRVTLDAVPDPGSVFRGWNGACSGTGPCTVEMYGDRKVTATFAVDTPRAFVVTSLDDAGPGSLRQALLDANANPGDDLIDFSGGLSGTITLLSGQLAITDSVVIDGPGADRLAVSGNDASRVFRVDPGAIGTVEINGLTVRDGHDFSFGGGGGIIVESGTITIRDSAIVDNISDTGGGGGGLRKFGPGVVTLINTTVSGNNAIDEFESGDGGGIRHDQEKLTLINSTVSGNFAATGGGIASDDGVLEISNSTIAGNSALWGGGGIYATASEIAMANSILAGNTAPTERELAHFGNPDVSRGHNLFGENGDAGVLAGIVLDATDTILAGPLDTLIGPLADNGGPTRTRLPVLGGAAIDAGDNGLIPPGIGTDQRGQGFAREVGRVDIGAVERTAHVAGTVTGPGGAPAANIRARALVFQPGAGDWRVVSQVDTDGDGAYQLNGLAPATYRVCFEDPYANRYFAGCHGDAPHAEDALDVVVQSGESRTGIDAQLVMRADLVVVTPASSPSSVDTGAGFTLSATVSNQGGDTDADMLLRYYRSANSIITPRDTEIGTDAVTALGAGTSSDQQIALDAPAATGIHYYGACLAPVAEESDPANNCSSAVRVAVTLNGHQPRPFQMAAGAGYSCVLDVSGVTCWGANGEGQSDVPPGLVDPLQIVAGEVHTCALDANGVTCWGSFEEGLSIAPDDLVDPVQIAAGDLHTCALDASGVTCWGAATEGQTNVPDSLIDPTRIAAGNRHTCALDANGVTCWGASDEGQTDVPPGLVDPVQIAAGALHTCALDANGVTCWGANDDGQTDVPPGLVEPVQIAAGDLHTCALDANGVTCWGANDAGQTDVPAGLTGPVGIAAGDAHSCALAAAGMTCWGGNDSGQTDVPAGLVFIQPWADLDLDGNGVADALTDGLLIARRLLGRAGADLVDGALAADASRTDPAAIAELIDAMSRELDIDADGRADARTDGLLILRRLLGLTGTALTQGALAPDAARTDPETVGAAIDALNR